MRSHKRRSQIQLFSCVWLKIPITIIWGPNGNLNGPQKVNACIFWTVCPTDLCLIYLEWQGIPKSCGDVSSVYHPFRQAWLLEAKTDFSSKGYWAHAHLKFQFRTIPKMLHFDSKFEIIRKFQVEEGEEATPLVICRLHWI